jgi:colanic acid biosynthesis glycosyl transferase WcaI
MPSGHSANGKAMPRVIFLNRFFYPDHSATSRMVSSLAFALAESGKEVHVITSRQLYDSADAGLPTSEVFRGVHIHRVDTTQFGRTKLVGRALDYLSFYLSSWRRVVSVANRGDIIVAKTDPPMISLVGMLAAKQRAAHLVNWLQDIYPETAIQFGVPFLIGPLRPLLFYLRNISLRGAKANVVIGELAAKIILLQGLRPDRVNIIHNWSDDEGIAPIGKEDNFLRDTWGLRDKFVVGYSGNLGRTHEFHTVLEASERLRHNHHIVFLFIGGGHHLDELAHLVKQRGLSQTYRFVPYQDDATLKYSLGVPDVHWISLRPEFEGLIVPSKFYGIAAAGRPMIAITAKDGELARLIEQHQCGLVVEPGNVGALEKALVLLSADNQLCTTMGTRARTMLDAHFTRRRAFELWRRLLTKVDSEV